MTILNINNTCLSDCKINIMYMYINFLFSCTLLVLKEVLFDSTKPEIPQSKTLHEGNVSYLNTIRFVKSLILSFSTDTSLALI